MHLLVRTRDRHGFPRVTLERITSGVEVHRAMDARKRDGAEELAFVEAVELGPVRAAVKRLLTKVA